MKGFINTAVAIAAVFSIAGGLLFAYAHRQPDIKVGAPSTALTYQATLLPLKGSAYDLGTSTDTWRNLFIDQVCLTSDTCRTTWPTSGGGGGGTGNVATSTTETAGFLSYWTSTGATPATLGKAATTSLTASLPLSLSNPISVIGASASALTINTSGTWSGNAGTATALAANGTNCSAGSYPLGVDASGNSETCTVATTGTVTSVTGTFPISSTGGATPNLTFVGLSTSSAISVASGLLYATGVNTLASISTSSAISLSITGNAGTATALAADGANCSAGNYPLGVDASGAVQNCTLANTGTVTSVATTYPVTGGTFTTSGTIALAFGTTTNNNWSGGNVFQSASTTFVGNATTTGTNFSGIASSSQLYGDNLATCNSGNVLTWSAGLFGCAADQTTAGAANPFTFATTYATLSAATTSPLWLQNTTSSLFASSTAYFGAGGVGSSSIQFGPTGLEWTLGYLGATDNFVIAHATALQVNPALTINKSTLNVATTYSTSTHQTITTNEWLTNTPSAALSTDASGLVIASTTGLVTATSPITLDSSSRRVFGGGVQISCASCALFAYDFTPATNYAVNTNSTTTPLWLKGAVGGIYSFMASNTAAFDQINVGSSTSSGQATSTFFGNLITKGTASSTALIVSNSPNGPLSTDSNGNVSASTTGLVTSGTGISLDSSARRVFGGGVAITNSGVISGSCSGGTTCSGTNPLVINSFSYPFTLGTNFGVAASMSTGTLVAFTAGLAASSTSYFNTISALTSSTTNASTTNLSATTFAAGGTGTTSIDIAGGLKIQSLTGLTLATAGAVTAYAGTTCATGNRLIQVLSASGVATCAGSTNYDFTPGTINFGVNTNATGTIINFTAGIQASSTSYFSTISSLTSSTTEASTTDISARTLAVGGTATTSIDAAGLVRAKNLTLFSITGTAANCLSADTNGVVSGTGNACGSAAGGPGIADPFTHSANFGTTLASATTTPIWFQNYLFASSTAYLSTAFHASSTAPQLYLSDTTSNSNWAFRAISGNLFIATTTSTVVPFATSTFPILTITNGGLWGIGTTSPWARFTLDRFGQTNNAYASSSILVTEYAIATTTNKTIDARDGNSQLFQIGSAATTITLTGFLPGSQLTLHVCNPNATAGAITWATSPANLLQWTNSSTSPTQTTTANKCDIYHFDGTAATSSGGIAQAGISLSKIFAWLIPNF